MDVSELQVLLVEPSPTQQRIIAAEFARLGIDDLRAAGNAGQALEDMRVTRPDLVVSAMYLPDMTGTDLLLRMRAQDALRDTAFMLVSSESDTDVLEPVRQAGAVAILPKPFHHRHLACAIHATVDLLSPSTLTLGDEDIEDIRVLLVDDSRLARNHLRRVLTDLGISHFTEAENGVQAIERLNENYFDLVVTDYHMPEMDGRQLVEYIRGQGDQRSIPVMMVTSEVSGSRLSAVKQAGVSAICDKPFNVGIVRNLLQGMLS